MTELYAPAEYWQATDAARAEVCNGCGTKGLAGLIIPDNLVGLNIRPLCDIHDWMYTFGATIEDKEIADRSFLNNMVRLIDDAGGPEPLMALRRQDCMVYYSAVRDFGGPAFWKGKNNPEDLGHA